MSESVEFSVPDEWAQCVLALRGFGGEFTEGDFLPYLVLLDDLDPDVVFQAIRRLARSGRDFFPRPSAAQVGAEAALILDPSSAPVGWAEFWQAFQVAAKAAITARVPAGDQRAVWVGETITAELGPVAGGYATKIYAHAVRVDVAGEFGGRELGRLRGDWEEEQEVMRDRVARGATLATPAEIVQRTGRRPRSLGPAAAPLQLETAR